MGKERKPYYNKKYLASTGQEWDDITGKRHLTKQSAMIASFLIILYGRLRHGFPIILKWFWFNAIAIWPFIFIRVDSVTSDRLNHEMIHIRQQLEMLIVFAYVWYLVEMIIRILLYGFNVRKAYYFHSMEREARVNQANGHYLLHRKHYSFLKYL